MTPQTQIFKVNGTVPTKGQLVKVDTTGTRYCTLVNTTNANRTLGVVLDVYTGGVFDKVSVAVCGKYLAKAAETITAGEGISSSSTAGGVTGHTSNIKGLFGIALESAVTNDLFWIMLRRKREMY